MNSQIEAYGEATQIHSDPFGLIKRDNRNHRKKQELILEHVHAQSGDRVLEVGCGDGLHAPKYADRFDYVGIDISETLCRSTEAQLPDDAVVLPMDAMDLSFDDDSFDGVVGSAILHHLSDPKRALAEWIRVTKPGGSVTLMEPNYLFPKDTITAHLVEHEKHKTMMAPWRVRRILDELETEYGVSGEYQHRIFTPPWPESHASVLDRIDDACREAVFLKRVSQMLLIHIEC